LINTKVPSTLLHTGRRHFGVEFSRGRQAICPDTPLAQADPTADAALSVTDWYRERPECHAA
jgi:hypothetical protein